MLKFSPSGDMVYIRPYVLYVCWKSCMYSMCVHIICTYIHTFVINTVDHTYVLCIYTCVHVVYMYTADHVHVCMHVRR